MEDSFHVNDGGGLWDNEGLVNTLIVDCNSLQKLLIDGQYVGFCSKIVEMVQKLSSLQDGIKADMAAKDKVIDELRRRNMELSEKVYGLPVDIDEDPAVSPDDI